MGLVTVTEKDDIGVATTRSINTTLPLAGGGNLSADRTLSVNNATTTTVGVLQLAGDLGGTGTAPAVLKINGVSVTGTPSAGYSIVATGAAAATWQAAGSVEVPNSRTISTTLPLTGGGDLSANRTLGVNNATTSTVGVVQLAGNLDGTATVPIVDGLTADSISIQNADLTHKGVWSTTGLRIGDNTAATEKLDVVGRAKIGVSTAKIFLDGYPGLTGTYAAMWGGNITPSSTNYAFLSNGAGDTTFNTAATGSIAFAVGHSAKAILNSTGFRIGDNTAPTEKLEVTGNIKYDIATTAPKLYQADNVTNGATAQPLLVQAQNATGTTSIGGILTLQSGAGVANPGSLILKRGSNIVLTANANYSDSTYQTTLYGGPVNGLQLVSDAIYFGNNAGGFRGRWNSVGLRVGDGVGATEKLEVTGNIKYDSTVATPKFYQADVTTNGTAGAAMTIQSQNATGTTTIGGALTIQTGDGTTGPGVFTIKRGSTAIFETGGNISDAGWFTQVTGGPVNGLALKSDAMFYYTSAGTGKGRFTNTGFRIGDAVAPTERLEVVGSIKIDTAVTAPKLYQADNVTNGASAQTLTIQAANATGTTSVGGFLDLKSGTGTTSPGVLRLYTGGTLSFETGGAAGSQYSQLKSGAAGGIYLDADICRFRSSVGVEFANARPAGLRIGDNTAAGEKLDVVGRAKIGVGAGKVIIDSSMNASSIEGGIWMGTATPTNANYRLRGDANYLYLNGTTATYFSTGVGATIRATIGDNGLRIGDSTLPTDKLEVVGNSSLLGNATIGLAAVTSAHTLRGSVVSTTRTVSADLVVDTTTKDLTVFVDTTAAVRTITLPTPTNGRIVWIKRTAGTNYVSVVPSSGWIEKSNVTSIRLVTYVPVDSNTGIHPYLSLQADGTNWYIMRHFSIELVLT